MSSGSPPGLDGAVTKVQVRGLHSDITDEDLEAYFETPKSGGKKGAVVRCIFEEGGIACIEFNAPEGKYAQKGIANLYIIILESCCHLWVVCPHI